MERSAIALFALLTVLSCAKPAAIEVKDVWTRETVGDAANAAVFMTIRSPTPDRLISASTPVAKKTDLMTMEGGASVMQMAYLKAIDIPAGSPVSLNPSGLHVWLAGLNQPLKAGSSFPLTLKFERAGDRQVAVAVIEPAAAPPVSE